jgi:hypothetical protein
MTTTLLIVHGLLAVALLGAVTHQVASVLWPAARPAGSFTGRFRSVAAPGYANAIVVLYVATAVLGAIIYGEYRISIRIVLEELQLRAANGSFELKEHLAAVALGMLPAYWWYWRQPAADASVVRVRAILTAVLAFVVWWNFLVGHIVNNIRGFGS